MNSKWLIRTCRKEGRAPLRLFCLPYAGGGASVYRTWGEALWPMAEVYAVQLPGREERFGEPRWYSIQRLVGAMLGAEEGQGWFDVPYVLFGHSMGAKIVFEMARRLEAQNRPPVRVVVSGSRSPNLPSARHISDLPDSQFNEELRHLAGTPEAILREEEFMRMYRPILRADFAMDESYESKAVISAPLTALAGRQDTEVNAEDLVEWGRRTRGGCTPLVHEGEHFFLKDNTPEFLQIVKGVLDETLRGMQAAETGRCR